jgi:DNA mismatch repair protein MutL
MIMRSAVRQALGKYSITPSIDFDIEKSQIFPEPSAQQSIKIPEVKVDPYFNPFHNKERKEMVNPRQSTDPRRGLDQWEKLYDLSGVELTPKAETPAEPEQEDAKLFSDDSNVQADTTGFLQLRGENILTQIKSGLMVIHQQSAYERIFYERIMGSSQNDKAGIQQQLFPRTLTFSASDAHLIIELHDELLKAGFDIQEFGPNTFVLNGVPSDANTDDVQGLIEGVIENYKKNLGAVEGDKQIRLATSLARQMSLKQGKPLTMDEMRSVVDQLFACSTPYASPSGRKTFVIIANEELEQKFKQTLRK